MQKISGVRIVVMEGCHALILPQASSQVEAYGSLLAQKAWQTAPERQLTSPWASLKAYTLVTEVERAQQSSLLQAVVQEWSLTRSKYCLVESDSASLSMPGACGSRTSKARLPQRKDNLTTA